MVDSDKEAILNAVSRDNTRIRVFPIYTSRAAAKDAIQLGAYTMAAWTVIVLVVSALVSHRFGIKVIGLGIFEALVLASLAFLVYVHSRVAAWISVALLVVVLVQLFVQAVSLWAFPAAWALRTMINAARAAQAYRMLDDSNSN